MARSHAKVLVQVWRDRDWCALSMPAQWLYVLILSQPKLSLVGSLEVTTGRWANLVAGVDRDTIDAALSELETAGKVIVDEHTDELLIRTFTAHDIDPNRLNVNLVKGLWGHWSCIASDRLRALALAYMPDAVWEKIEPHAPSDAAEIRRSARLQLAEGSRSQPEQPPRFEPPPSSHLPTDTTCRPGANVVRPQAVGDRSLLSPQEMSDRAASRARQFQVIDGNPNPAASGSASGAQCHPCPAGTPHVAQLPSHTAPLPATPQTQPKPARSNR